MIISLLNLKGGSGKSTVAINLAVGFALEGKKTLLVDTDVQGTSLTWSGERASEMPLVKVFSMPNHKALRNQIESDVDNYDVILIDGAPQIDLISAVSISLSDIVIIPVTPSPNDLWSTETIVERVKSAHEVNKNIKSYFLINRDSPRTLISKDIEAALKMMGVPLLKTKINHRVAYPDATNNGLSVLEWSDPKAKQEIMDLLKEIHTII